MTTYYHFTPKSSNAKTGPMPVTTTSRNSCPDTCAFKNNGCYAESGPLRIHWDKVSDGSRGIDKFELGHKIQQLPARTLWRHNQAGDISFNDLGYIARINQGKCGFTYTHNHSHQMLEKIRMANAYGFTVNLSANNLSHADELLDLNIGPVCSVVPSDYHVHGGMTPKGRRVKVCPATQLDHVNCANCGLCQIANRDYVIAFPAHGTGKRKANGVANG